MATTNTPNYEIDPNDKRLTAVDNEESAELKTNANTYDSMIKESDSFYNAQINASKEYAETQKKLQNEQTEFAIDKIEQQKAQAQKDYQKEQSGAYVDWQKESNKYGVNAEQMASQGLSGTGYSESSKVSMFNTYQNRIAKARESYSQAVVSYNNAITEARLQNNSALAEIAYNALLKQLELSLAGFQYKNTLITEKANKELTIKQMYDTKWQNVYDNIMNENKLAEEVRQYNESLAFQKEQFAFQKQQYNDSQSAKINKTSSGSGNSVKSTKSSSSNSKLSNKSLNKTIESNAKGTAYNNILSKVGSITTKAQADNLLKSLGINTGEMRILTSAEWYKAKRIGEQGSELRYSSYPEYLREYVKAAIS